MCTYYAITVLRFFTTRCAPFLFWFFFISLWQTQLVSPAFRAFHAVTLDPAIWIIYSCYCYCFFCLCFARFAFFYFSVERRQAEVELEEECESSHSKGKRQSKFLLRLFALHPLGQLIYAYSLLANLALSRRSILGVATPDNCPQFEFVKWNATLHLQFEGRKTEGRADWNETIRCPPRVLEFLRILRDFPCSGQYIYRVIYVYINMKIVHKLEQKKSTKVSEKQFMQFKLFSRQKKLIRDIKVSFRSLISSYYETKLSYKCVLRSFFEEGVGSFCIVCIYILSVSLSVCVCLSACLSISVNTHISANIKASKKANAYI